MAQAAAVSIVPASWSEISGVNWSRTIASSSIPSWSFLASSLDTNEFPAAEEVTNEGCWIIQIDKVNRPTDDFGCFADC